ncbi:MAG: hypothetical protein WDN72_08070 [Alphaproteobacteria bacterium]
MRAWTINSGTVSNAGTGTTTLTGQGGGTAGLNDFGVYVHSGTGNITTTAPVHFG